MAIPATLGAPTDGRSELIDEIVASLPASTYRELAWPGETVASCLRELDRSRRDDNPRAIREWVDYHGQTPDSKHLIGCLDAAISTVVVRDLLGRSEVSFLHQVRDDAVAHLREKHRHERVALSITMELQDLVDGLVRIVAAYDRATAEHLDDVGQLAERLAVALGLSLEQVARATLAGRLHDIGKMAVSRSILLKPMQLSASEWDELKTVPRHGAAIILGIPKLAPLATIVELHHERIDGAGYPSNLVGHEIPIESRVIAIVDAFHAMTTVKPYHRPITTPNACAELLRCSGTQFDREIVEVFVKEIGYRGSRSRYAASP